MSRKMALIPLALFAALMALFALPLLQGKDPSVVPSAMVGRKVPSFDLPAALKDIPGFSDKDVKELRAPCLVNFFASWCLTCAAEHKLLTRIARAENIPVYGIDYKDKKDDVARWIARHGNPYRAVGFDGDGRAGIDWGAYGVPETYVIDAGGVIRYRFPGPMTDEDYQKIIKPLLEGLKK